MLTRDYTAKKYNEKIWEGLTQVIVYLVGNIICKCSTSQTVSAGHFL